MSQLQAYIGQETRKNYESPAMGVKTNPDYIEGGKGGSRSRFMKNRIVISRFTEYKMAISRKNPHFLLIIANLQPLPFLSDRSITKTSLKEDHFSEIMG